MLGTEHMIITLMSMFLAFNPCHLEDMHFEGYIESQNQTFGALQTDYEDQQNRFVLLDEYLNNDDEHNPDISMFTRVYLEYDFETKSSTPYTVIIGIEKVDSMTEARLFLKDNHPDDYEFENNTVISKQFILKTLFGNGASIRDYLDDILGKK